MKTLLVIGGTGFFGKSILDAFGRGLLTPWNVKHVIVISRHADALLKTAPQLVNKNVTLLSADITTTNSLPFADYVIHAAASTDVRNYTMQPEQERLNILAGTYHYCELAKQFHAKSKIVYVSSGAVYGKQPPELEKISEDYQFLDAEDIPEGKRDYARAKRDAELAVIKLGADGFHVSIARCFAFVGRWLPRDQHFAIGNFMRDTLEGGPIVVQAKHKVYRSYMYADDLVEWLMTIANNASKKCPTYNVGSDEAILLDDLANKLAQFYNIKAEAHLAIEGKVDRYIPSIEKAKTELSLRLKHDLMASTCKAINALN
jgi:nucleoside-diphosphate-sugar epimerase